MESSLYRSGYWQPHILPCPCPFLILPWDSETACWLALCNHLNSQSAIKWELWFCHTLILYSGAPARLLVSGPGAWTPLRSPLCWHLPILCLSMALVTLLINSLPPTLSIHLESRPRMFQRKYFISTPSDQPQASYILYRNLTGLKTFWREWQLTGSIIQCGIHTWHAIVTDHRPWVLSLKGTMPSLQNPAPPLRRHRKFPFQWDV